MKLWIDDVRPAPEGYVRCKSINEAIATIITSECRNSNKPTPVTEIFPDMNWNIELIDIDHDAGEYAGYCGYDDVTGPGKWIYDKKHSVFIKVGDA